jgi:hypothetical protein
MRKQAELKVGDLVRVQGSSFMNECKSGRVRHNLKAGSVGEVVRVGTDSVCVHGPYRHDPRYNESPSDCRDSFCNQSMRFSQVKLAKQAMSKREAYQSRR